MYFDNIKILELYQGTWISNVYSNDLKIVFNGSAMTESYSLGSGVIKNYTYGINVDNDQIYLTLYNQKISAAYLLDSNNKLIIKDLDSAEIDSYSYYSPDRSAPVESKEPVIGMTAEELENSTWGEPKDINHTTTSYGVSEQWVYSGYR